MFSVSGCNRHGAKREGFPYGGACTEKSVKWDSHSGNSKGRGGSLSQKITCEGHADIPWSKSGFSKSQCGCFFLHGAFRSFPGSLSKHRFFADQIKFASKRSFPFLFSNYRSTAYNVNRILKAHTGRTGKSGWCLWIHEITSIIFRR